MCFSSAALPSVLTLDRIAANALQIFSSTAQLSGSKAGSWNKKREGLSLLSLLSRCSSVVGSRHLRSLLRCPSTSLAVLKSRHRAIAFFSAAQNVEVVKALIAGLKQVKNAHQIMKKLSGSKTSIADWRSLQRTLAGIWQLMEVRFNFSFTMTFCGHLSFLGGTTLPRKGGAARRSSERSSRPCATSVGSH